MSLGMFVSGNSGGEGDHEFHSLHISTTHLRKRLSHPGERGQAM